MQQNNTIENLRKVMGTHPSDKPIKKTDIVALKDSLEVTIESATDNPYKAMFVSSTATWGDNEYKQKWEVTSKEGRFEIIKACLTHNTLPQCKEMVQFVFRIKGVPRWLFDYHVTTVQFLSIMSQGLRDNNRIDASVVSEFANDKKLFEDLKDLYEIALSDNQGSWQTARAFLTQAYSHSYYIGQNLLSIVGTRGFHASKKMSVYSTHEEEQLCYIYHAMTEAIGKKFPLLQSYCQILFHDNESIFEFIKNLKYDQLKEEDKKLFQS